MGMRSLQPLRGMAWTSKSSGVSNRHSHLSMLGVSPWLLRSIERLEKSFKNTVTDRPIIRSLTCEFSRSRAETVPTARNTVPCYRAFRVRGLVPRETTGRRRARSNAVPVLVSQHLVAATIKRVDETAGADVAVGETHRGVNDQIWTVAFVEFD